MMKKILFLISCLLFSFISISQNLNIEVTYQKALKKYNDETSNPPKILKGLNYLLKSNKESAIFTFEKSLQIDGANQRFVGRGGGKGVYYKNLKDTIRLEQKETVDGDLFLISDKYSKYNWTLSKESKKIGKYICFKATTTYQEFNPIKKKMTNFNIIVWYTPEIPLPYGPAGYDGLPGLVLESRNGSFYFIASEIKIKDSSLNKIKMPQKGKKVTLQEFNIIINKKMESVFGKNFYEKFKKNKKGN